MRIQSRNSLSKRSLSYGLAFSLMASAAMTGSAEARNGGALAAGLIGGVVAGALIGGMMSNSRQRQPRVVKQRPKGPSKQQVAESNKVVQSALAALGHYRGPVQGAMDKPTRDGIAAFQRSIGEKPTGRLTTKQREVLLAAYAQQNSGNTTQNAALPQPENQLHKLLAGGAAVGAGTMIGSQAVGQSPVIGQIFLASACANGGASAAPGIVLAGGQGGTMIPDQFCRARNAAITEAAKLITPEMGRDVEKLRRECRSATEQMAAYATAAASEPVPAFSIRLAKDFQQVKASGSTDVAVTAYKICLGLGYQEDRADMVMASGLGLVGLGLGGHGEVVAAALSQSVDGQARAKQAADWLDASASAIEKGAPSLDPALGPERATILRLASKQLRHDPATAGNMPQKIELMAQAPVPRLATVPPIPAPAPAAAPLPATVAVANPANIQERMKAEALRYFDAEKLAAKSALPGKLAAIGLSQDALATKCSEFSRPEDIASAKPVPAGELGFLDACRVMAYAEGRIGFMVAYDQRLADSGDKDAPSRLSLHRLAGH